MTHADDAEQAAASREPRSVLYLPLVRSCRVCGCTDDLACLMGCSWRPDDGRGPCCTRCDPSRYVYVASSWRNQDQPAVVEAIREAGLGVYDFRNPPNGAGFGWEEIHPDWQQWTAAQYVAALEHPRAVEGFASDFDAMKRADTVVLVLPCGRSAHLELGWAVGAGKRTAILLNGDHEPELMVKMVDHIAVDLPDLLAWLAT